LRSRREAWVIFLFWFLGLIWVVPVSYWYGYPEPAQVDQLVTVWGIPAWLFWGVAAPWLAANLLTTWFCFGYMKDEDLGHAGDEELRPTEEEAGRFERGGTP